jgi:hypothetical protein
VCDTREVDGQVLERGFITWSHALDNLRAVEFLCPPSNDGAFARDEIWTGADVCGFHANLSSDFSSVREVGWNFIEECLSFVCARTIEFY